MNWGIIRLRNKITQLRVGGRPLDPLARRNLHALDGLRLEAPAREHNFVILDLQAADPRAGADQVLSVGAFRMLEGRVMLGEVFWQQCRPDHEITEETLPLQAEAAQSDEAPRPLAEVFDDFLAFIGTDILVAHQAALETFILAQAMKARSGFGLQNLMLDTLEMCRILLRPHAYGAYLDNQKMHPGAADRIVQPGGERETQRPGRRPDHRADLSAFLAKDGTGRPGLPAPSHQDWLL